MIIPVLNGVGTLGDQLEALAGQDVPAISWEIIVADNGSVDGTRALALGHAGRLPRLRVLDASSQPGASHARNAGAGSATGELLCFCDADDLVAPGWLAAHVANATDHDFAGGPLEVELLNPARFRAWRPTPRTAIGKTPPSFAPTGNMSIWTDVFQELGGFDEGYLRSHDVEFSQRATANGYRLGWVPEAVVHYRYRQTLRSVAHQAFLAGGACIQMALDHPHAAQLPSWRTELASWLGAVVRLPTMISPRRRGSAVRLLAHQTGRLRAIMRLRGRLREARKRDQE